MLVRSQNKNGTEEIYNVLEDTTPKADTQSDQQEQFEQSEQSNQMTGMLLLFSPSSLFLIIKSENPESGELFIPLVLEELPRSTVPHKMETRYSLIQQIKKNAARSPQTREYVEGLIQQKKGRYRTEEI